MAKNQLVKTGKKLRGAVLVMVLTVMFMLIILLLATLTVVSTAQNRSYAKYEENQAYYTARSALDVFAVNMLADNTYYAQGASGNRTYNSLPVTQGFALQTDLYRIKAQAKTIAEYEEYLKKSDADKAAFKSAIASDTTVNPTTVLDGVDLSATQLSLYDYMEYEITMPKSFVSDATYGSGAEDNTAKDQFGSELKAKIKVEVLARSIGDKRSEDKMHIKVTATVPYQDLIGTASAVYQIVEKVNAFDNGLKTFNSLQSADNLKVFGGLATNEDDADGVSIPNMGVVVGTTYNNGKMHIPDGGATFALENKSVTFINGDLTFKNSIKLTTAGDFDESDMAERPIFYINGNLDLNSGDVDAVINGGAGSSSKPLTIVCNGVNMDHTPILSINGDLIVLGDFHMYAAKGVRVSGNVYVMGDFVIHKEATNTSEGEFSGNIFVAGKVDVSEVGKESNKFLNNVTIGNMHLYAEQGIDYWDKDSSTVQNISNTCSFDGVTADDIRLTAEGAFGLLEATGTTIKKSAVERAASTYGKIYNEYLRRSNVSPYNVISNNNFVTAFELAGSSKDEMEVGKYTIKKMPGEEGFDGGTVKTLGTGTTSVNGEEWFNFPNTSGNIKLTGSGTANIVLTPGYYSGEIISDDELTVNFYAPAGNYQWEVKNYNVSVKAALDSGELKLGTKTATYAALEAPKINFYIDGGHFDDVADYYTWDFGQKGWHLMTGYFYAPYSIIKSDGGTNYQPKCWFNGAVVTDVNGSEIHGEIFALGSMVAGDVQGIANGPVIGFIDPDNTSPSVKHNSIHKWAPVQYNSK